MTTTAITARAQFLLDVLTTAAEGGINYWAQITAYRWQGGPSSALVTFVEEDAEDEDPLITVTVACLRKAFAKLRQAESAADPDQRAVLGVARTDARRILGISAENGSDEVLDAGEADVMVQIAAFGQVVYC